MTLNCPKPLKRIDPQSNTSRLPNISDPKPFLIRFIPKRHYSLPMNDHVKNREQRIKYRDDVFPLDEIEKLLDDLLELGDRGAILFVDALICQAILHGASDLHLEPWVDCLALRFRLDGQLHPIALIAKRHQERIIARIKVLANLIIYKKDTPQDGRIEANRDRLDRAFRASTFPTIYGEKTVIRILDPQKELMNVASLGFRDEVVDGLLRLVFRPQGTLLLTGPSSSGKTTTIYALLRELMKAHSNTKHIVTIEDPVEYQLGRIGQSQINPNLGFTFDKAFRSLLRQDPDVIMVGEIRDTETARIAVQAGLTGHMIISTIHSGTAAGVFTRLLDMGIEPFLAASSLTGILAQRLVRTNCPKCAQSYKPEPTLLEEYGIPKNTRGFKRGTGCDHCRGFGFRGRQAVGELLMVNDEIADLVLTRARTRRLNEAALRNGMVTTLEHGIEKALEGKTTLEELQMVTPPPDPDDELPSIQRMLESSGKRMEEADGKKRSSAKKKGEHKDSSKRTSGK